MENKKKDRIKIKIVSDGTAVGTKIVDQDGRELETVQSISWKVDVKDFQVAKAEIVMVDIPVEVIGEATFNKKDKVSIFESGTTGFILENIKKRD